jgi:heme-degrading monooxygenase HmoA
MSAARHEPSAEELDRAGSAGYVSMSRLHVEGDRADELVDAFRDRLGKVDDADGFRGLQVWRSDRDGDELVMVSFWRDRAAFSEYMRGADHRESHDRIDPGLQAAIRLQRLEHLTSYDIVAR